MVRIMAYEGHTNIWWRSAILNEYADLMVEYQATGVKEVMDEIDTQLENAIQKLLALPQNAALRKNEPDDLEEIRALRPEGKRRFADGLPAGYEDRLAGAFLGRLAGCLLGSIVEGYPIEDMQRLAKANGDTFPPVDYWTKAPGTPGSLRYWKSPIEDYTRGQMAFVPVDDDIMYTLEGLLIMEEYGQDFTTVDVGESWLKYIPYGYTAEEAALRNLKSGLKGAAAALDHNPYLQLIGADIRSDPWAYMAPGHPEKAAEFAYRDAMLTHRRNGVYGAMYFAAAESIAFCVDDPMEALRLAMAEIPQDCLLARSLRWAFAECKNIHTYQEARDAVDRRFPNMPIAHTLNNACLTVFGIHLGSTDFTKVISNTVAMGLDNDCTAATAGSIVGAVIGKGRLPEHWYVPFHNRICSYLNGIEEFAIDDTLARFKKQALQVVENR